MKWVYGHLFTPDCPSRCTQSYIRWAWSTGDDRRSTVGPLLTSATLDMPWRNFSKSRICDKVPAESTFIFYTYQNFRITTVLIEESLYASPRAVNATAWTVKTFKLRWLLYRFKVLLEGQVYEQTKISWLGLKPIVLQCAADHVTML